VNPLTVAGVVGTLDGVMFLVFIGRL